MLYGATKYYLNNCAKEIVNKCDKLFWNRLMDIAVTVNSDGQLDFIEDYKNDLSFGYMVNDDLTVQYLIKVNGEITECFDDNHIYGYLTRVYMLINELMEDIQKVAKWY